MKNAGNWKSFKVISRINSSSSFTFTVGSHFYLMVFYFHPVPITQPTEYE